MQSNETTRGHQTNKNKWCFCFGGSEGAKLLHPPPRPVFTPWFLGDAVARTMATLKNSSRPFILLHGHELAIQNTGSRPSFHNIKRSFWWNHIGVNVMIPPTRPRKVKLLRKKKNNNYLFSSVRIVYGIRWTAVEK